MRNHLRNEIVGNTVCQVGTGHALYHPLQDAVEGIQIFLSNLTEAGLVVDCSGHIVGAIVVLTHMVFLSVEILFFSYNLFPYTLIYFMRKSKKGVEKSDLWIMTVFYLHKVRKKSANPENQKNN